MLKSADLLADGSGNLQAQKKKGKLNTLFFPCPVLKMEREPLVKNIYLPEVKSENALLPPDLRGTFSSLAVCFGQGCHLPYFCLFFVKNDLVDLKQHGGILSHAHRL